MDTSELQLAVRKHIHLIRDFPYAGINFRDIMPLFAQPHLVDRLLRAITAHCRNDLPVIDVVAGLEARGFLLGPQIALLLGVPFVPIRKKGKLPGKVVRATYLKEYGTDEIEVQENAFQYGQNVFIIDDLLATGGTLKAACGLVNSIGVNVAEAYVVIELPALRGRDKLAGVRVSSFTTFDD